jgi:hypothetical protein
MLQLSIAKELGITLAKLTDEMTYEELMLWNTFYQIEKEEADKESKRRR